MAAFIDFAQVKDRAPIEDVLTWLQVPFRRHGPQLRGPCPVCNANNARAFVATPDKGVWFCFSNPECKGGDVIQLVAKVKKIGVKEAAHLLAEQFGTPNRAEQPTVPKAGVGGDEKPQGALRPLEYLVAAHEGLQALGISEATAALFASGYAPRGVLRGRYAVPIHDKSGVLLAYVGIAVTKEQSPHLLFHNFDPRSAVWNTHRVAEKGDLWVCRDPLQAVLAVENGIPAENVVSFLAPITAQSLEVLAALMDEKQVEHIELF